MKIKNIETKENNIVSFSVTIEASEFEAALNKAYLKNKKAINVPGFRKGKAPRMVIEGYYGADVFNEEALETLYPIAYEIGVSDESFEPVGRPSITDIDIADDKVVTMTFETATYPEVTLGQYKDIEAVKTVEAVTDEEIMADVEKMREKGARIETVERPVENGDIAVIDFEGFKDGVAFEGGKGENHELTIGSGQFIPGFEEQVIGMAVGEEKDVEVSFPAEYHAAELAGAPVVFKVKVNEVKVKQLPELDDDFAKDVSEFDTLEALKEDAKTRLTEGREQAADSKFREAVLDKAIENMQLELPDAMVEEKVDAIMNDYAQNMAQYGMTLEQYAGMMGMDANGLRQTVVPGAKRQVLADILFRKVSETENFEIPEAEFEEEYSRLAEQYKMEVEKVKEIVPAEALTKELGLMKASELIYTSGIAIAE